MMPVYRVVLSDTTSDPPPANRTAWSRDISADNEFDAVRLAHAAYQQEFGHACTCCSGRVTELPLASTTPIPPPPAAEGRGTIAAA
jgi:hypothetical protein